jgi:proteasome lid subunit RPN8/RPN11
MSREDVPPTRQGAHATLRISREVVAAILDHARRCLPEECCGLLLGHGTVVLEAWPARNEFASPARYRVDPRDYVAAASYGRRHGLDVVGAYHSHPVSQAVPSPADLAESAGEAFIYVIAGPIGPSADAAEVRAYRFAGGNFAELPLVTDTQEALS